MKQPVTSILIFVITFATSCNFNKKQIDVSGADEWQSIYITDDNRVVTGIQNNNDSSIVKVYHRGSIFTTRPNKIIIDTLKTWFSRSEKDSLAYLAKSIILNPVKTKSFCTEFVGTVKIEISYGQFKQSGGYTSVCDWPSLSNQTKQLNNILQRKMKKLKKEE
ncbi:hypothetical protein [Mucilaginibacter aquaedulcis]|uniref:hypothetical protein n=1 Tax=Mucilaginibacter aquaedulcis TaxID=1187081 RepID=UPI0025B3B482|nr:hypothetical protein [Mucilaginibacter aquaedulcis]MDN3549239.1 hypothetical protein [Mucilaginibacter aquaedulcis]